MAVHREIDPESALAPATAADTDIAIIGAAVRVPGAATIDRFWRNLCDGVESITRFARAELEPSLAVPRDLHDHPDFVPAAGILGDIDRFDCEFFAIPHAEAQLSDPQHRVFLECAWSALEDAGYDPESYPGQIALYAGAAQSEHLFALLGSLRREPAALYQAMSGASPEGLVTKTSYRLHLRGESIAVNTACSTGLVAVHMAAHSLLVGQSEMALAGAVRIAAPERTGYLFQEGMIFSPDGHCRPFDHRARGTVASNGAGVVVLKPLASALRDGDHVYAVIKGSAINNDGRRKVGYTAPSVEGQSDVITQALANGGVDPDTIGYVEAHGTGTPLGDPIEIAALSRAFRERSQRRQYCALGSVKSNLGHLDTAAGVVGLIKAALALDREAIPPSLHFEQPNDQLALDGSPFYVADRHRPWPRGPAPRRAAVSSFGIGGTNAHAVLEEAPLVPGEPSPRPLELITLSARSAAELQQVAAELADAASARPDVVLADLAFTRNAGRRAFAHRRAVVAETPAALAEALRRPARATEMAADAPRVAWLVPGNGAAYAGMGRGLYAAEVVFRRALDRASAIVEPELGVSLAALIAAGSPAVASPELASPALFAIQTALAALWQSWGIAPDAALGHSFGEYATAHLAGVFSLDDGMRIARRRGALIAAMPPGAMLAVALPAGEAARRGGPAIELAADNGGGRSVVSGPPDAIDALRAALAADGIAATPLAVDRAFHTAAVAPAADALAAHMARIALAPPRMPYVSSLTGAWIRAEEATSPAYWARQMREPVRFAGGVAALRDAGAAILLELGPDQALSQLCRAELGPASAIRVVAGSPRRGERAADADCRAALTALGELFAAGRAVDWAGFYTEQMRRRISLPTYPFARAQISRISAAPAGLEAERAPAPPAAPPAPAPLGDAEEIIARVWRDALGVDEIGRDDDFLAIGGNSLVAVQILTRLREAFPGVDIPLEDLFEASTIRTLAAQIDARRGGARTAGAPAIASAPAAAARALSAVEQRVFAIEQAEPRTPALLMPIAVAFDGAVDERALEDSLHDLVARHPGLRSAYRLDRDRRPIAEAAAAPFTVERADLEPLAPDQRARALDELAEREAARSFDIARGPLVRALWVRLGPAAHQLFLTVHHLVCDTASLELLCRDLGALYAARAQGRTGALPALPIEYGDFAAWQARALAAGADGELAAQLAYWRRQIAPMPPRLPFPVERRAARAPQFVSAAQPIAIPARTAEALRSFCRSRSTTPYVAVLAAYAALLGGTADRERVLIGTPLGNRSRRELASIVGYVAHSIGLAIALDGDPTFDELVARAHRTVLDGQRNPDVPFEALAPQQLGRLFDATFVLHGRLETTLEVPGGVTLRLLRPEAATQFGATLAELALILWEKGDALTGALRYNPQRFDADAAAAYAGGLVTLLEAAIARPAERVRSLVRPTARAPERARGTATAAPPGAGPLELSLFYFASDEETLAGNKYRLLLEGAAAADRLGFRAIWTPERHFHSFGGTYPNPSVVGAAIAARTERISIRAGSVVLPLHDPIRVAEEWAVVDNISGGRVGLSFASGWHAQDFILAPDAYGDRKQLMIDRIQTVRRLWRGEPHRGRDGTGAEIEVRIRPRPVQPELPFWVTSGGNRATFELAGELGGNLLTNLMGQRVDDLAEKIAAYRAARRRTDGSAGHVTLMLHAFVGDDTARVRRTVRGPLRAYLRRSIDLLSGFVASLGLAVRPEQLTPSDLDALLDHGLDRYLDEAGLFGTPEDCLPLVRRVQALGVDEIACLIDFGVDPDEVVASLPALAQVGELANRGATVAMAAAMPAPPDELPLSFVQERLWFLDQLEPGLAAYNNPVALRLRGALSAGALAASLDDVLERHAILRTGFVRGAAGPVQQILDRAPVALEQIDLAHAADRDAELARRLTARAAAPFDLSRAPLVRAALYRLGPDDHVLLVVMHHIVSDGWSSGVLLRELAVLYAAHASGRPSPLPPLPIQYADFARWQRAQADAPRAADQLAFWRDQLADVPALALPADRPRPPRQTFRGALALVELPRALVDGLDALGKRERATPFMVLLAAFDVLLHRYSGQTDFAVGTPTANRTRPEHEALVGCFVNTLALRADLAGDPTFVELLGRIRARTLAAYAHQDVPFERLLSELRIDRDLARSPLFQVMLVLHNTPVPKVNLGGLTLTGMPVDNGTAALDLMLELTPSAGGLTGWIKYNSDLFDGASIARFAQQLRHLLAAIVADPGARVSALPLVSDDDVRVLGASGERASTPRLFLDCFADAAARWPDRAAVIAPDGRLAYGALAARAHRLAHRLRARGAGPETVVGVYAERSIAFVVGVLGILEAGAAYLPLDPSHPPDRHAKLLADSGALFAIGAADVDDDLHAEPAARPAVLVRPESLAYVIYTSGSTGQPKGVAVEHRQLAGYLAAITERAELAAGRGYAHVSSFAADLGHTMLFPALAAGGTLHVLGDGDVFDPQVIAAAFAANPIDYLKATPSHIAALASCDALPAERLILGGERLRWDVVDELAARRPGCAIMNHYGPTETTVGVLAYAVSGRAAGATVPIGRPLPGVRAYLLDHRMNPVPIGVPGELYIGGDTVARGYLGRPAATAERFVPDPFGAPGARLYRTGDRARWLADGNVEFLGRADEQVKIRGYRVEPAEIEAALRAQPNVRDAVVVARADERGEPRLIAYVAGAELAPHALRAALQAILPRPMVPSAIVVLPALPLAPTGKVDRRALPAPPAEAGDAVAPDGLVEETLVRLWSELLRVERVGATDDFFELGGHSLLATQLCHRVREALGVELAVRALFEAPTPRELARRVAAQRAPISRDTGPIPLLSAAQKRAGVPLSHGQARIWFLQQLEPESPVYTVPMALRLTGPLDVGALGAALTEIVRRHETLRTVFAAARGEPLQIVADPVEVPVERDDVSALPPGERAAATDRLLRRAAARPFDLTRAPLLRALVVRTADDEHVLLLTVHHIAFDGWSTGVLFRELTALYAEEPAALRPLPIQYADYAQWQRAWIERDVAAPQLAYWRRQLADLPPQLSLPTDWPRPAVQSHRGHSIDIALSPELSRAVRELARREGATPHMVLFAAFEVLLARLSGQRDFAVGSPVANRTRPDVEELVGFFLNTLVMRADLSGAPTVRALLRRVKETALDAYAHQDLPFEQLVEQLGIARSLSRTPLFQVMFILQNAPLARRAPSGVVFSPVPVDSGAAELDLMVIVEDAPDAFVGHWGYCTDLFEAETIRRMAAQFAALLAQFAADPGASIDRLVLCDPAERAALLAGARATAAEIPDASLIERIAATCARRGDACAIECAERSLSYAALGARVAALSAVLRARGVGPEVRVAICVERSPELVIALLAVLHAGGAYVPLDPEAPPARNARVIADSGAAVVLTESDLAAALADADAAADAPRPRAPEQLAYVMYTSGSTGAPKGVAISHRALDNFVAAIERLFPLAETDAVVAVTTVAFDIAALELFAPLVAGAKLVIAPRDTARDGEALAALVERARPSLMQATPATWRMLVDAGWRGDPQLRILCGGEALPAPLAGALLDRGAALWNLYGPTETTIWSAARPVGRDESPPRIGGALANTQLHVLDEHGELLPIGIPGELHIGGAGVARGYLGRPELTAERFVPDPFSDAPGARMYRTGDLVRRRPDQTLEFLGRLDRQIKVRGHRIELGEIEAALRAHPGVADAAVVGAPDAAGQPRIVGYVAPSIETEDMSGLGAEWIRRWQITSDEVVRAAAAPAAPRENFAGWISSYTGAPIAEPEMREWVEHNVARILQHRPRAVLDVGCGPGLLLFAIAPHCARYVGVDHAPSALDYVRPRLADLPHVELAERTAHQLDDFAPGSFDAVVFSSVVQYFPSAEYLEHVLALAVRAVAPGGVVYIGDVRSLAHLEALHESIELARAGGALPAEQLRERVRRAVEREEELVLDPAFFEALRARVPAIERVRVELKGGRARNELTRFRYDVTLHVGDPARPGSAPSAPAAIDPNDPIDGRGLDLARLGELLGAGADALDVVGIPNARLCDGDGAVEPDAIRELARAHGFDVELAWSRALDEMDASFVRPGARTRPRTVEPGRPLANRPLASAACRELPAQLRPFLGERLPDYMIPSAIVAIPALPRLPNGKLDARALPPPEARSELDAAYAAPRTPAEARLAEIFAEVLGVARVGVHDDFFALGGHSLLATQVVSRIRAAFAADLPLRALFVSPTVAALAASLGESAESAAADADADADPPLVAIDRAGELALSFAQQRMWFLHAIAPDSPVFHICGALRITGELDHAALARALDALVQRHEALRTRFVASGGAARQEIAPPAPIALEIIDSGGDLAHLAEEAARAPFRLDEAPLFRTVLVRRSPREHVLIVALHHIISDGWSLGVVVRELGELYAGRGAALPALDIQYADYAAWQRRWLAGARRDRELAYWRAHLADLEPLDLPSDRPRPAQRTWVGRKVAVALDRALTDRLDELARAAGATLFMALAAAFQVWLGRLSGATRFGVGTPIANRTRRETEGVVGCFVNTLVLRADLAGAPSFRDVLARVRADALDAYAHQQVPFEEVVDAVAQRRDPSRHALFDVMLVLQNAPAAPLVLEGLTLELEGIETGAAWFDLTLSLRPSAAGLSGVLEYSADLFDRATAERMAADFAALVAAVAAAPDARPRAALPPAAWNDTAAAYPRDRCIHELFAEQAAATPDAIAIESAGETLTYRELDERAGRLANHLAASGVGLESRVALCLPRSADLVVAMLAVLKAGGAYVPLDPSYPRARLDHMMRDADAQLALTPSALEAIRPKLGQYATAAPRVRVDPQHLAYVIYTSGSTGVPRAAAIPHRGVVRLALDARDPALGRDRAILQLAPVSFDVSTYEVWGALLRGARLVIFPAEIPTAAALSAILARSQVTTLLLTASLFHVLCDEDPALFRPLRHLLVGGEPLSPRHVARARAALPDTAIINSYGPCECTTVACSYVADLSGDTAVPIGRPVSNAAVYVLDENLEPVAVGVTGELFITGDGLARGYLGRPDLTAERFVPDPFGAPGGRMYRTGDLVRWRRDGNLEFVGRRDHQVKVRGHRVELTEIEAALGAHPAVDACAVALREDVAGDRRLVGYVVAANAPADAALRDHLVQRLPDYMIPTAWVRLAALPLNANGKLDRGALPAPASAAAAAHRAPPRDPLEAQLVALWSGVLGAHDVGVRDDFFARGGNSLLAVRLVARLHAATGVALPLRDFFAAPTIEAVAARLRAGRSTTEPAILVPLGTPARSGTAPLFCVHALGGTVGCYAELARALALPVYALQAQGLDGAPLLPTIPALARCYLDAIRGAQPRGPYRIAGWSLGGAIAYEIACQLAAAGDTVELLALIDSHAPPLPPPLALDDESARIAALRRELADAGVDPADLERHYQIALRNGRALVAYAPGRYGGAVQLFRAGDRARPLAPDLGWSPYAAQVIATDVPGDHDTILRGDGAAALARHLEALAGALRR